KPWSGCRNDNDIGAPALRQIHDSITEVRIARIVCRQGAEVDRPLPAVWHGVRRQHDCARALHQHREHQTNGTLPQDYDHVVRLGIELDDALQTRIERLDEGRMLVRHARRNLLDTALNDPVHHADILRESASRRLIPCRHADLFVDEALRVQLMPAIKTFHARDMVEYQHPFPNLVSTHIPAHRGYLAGRLVTVNPRWRQQV